MQPVGMARKRCLSGATESKEQKTAKIELSGEEKDSGFQKVYKRIELLYPVIFL